MRLRHRRKLKHESETQHQRTLHRRSEEDDFCKGGKLVQEALQAWSNVDEKAFRDARYHAAGDEQLVGGWVGHEARLLRWWHAAEAERKEQCLVKVEHDGQAPSVLWWWWSEQVLGDSGCAALEQLLARGVAS